MSDISLDFTQGFLVTGGFVILGLFHDLQKFLPVTGNELGMFLVIDEVFQGIGVFPVIIELERRQGFGALGCFT